MEMTRQARCTYCKTLRPSSEHEKLPFFEARGPDSPIAKQSCKNCGYYESAHERKKEPQFHRHLIHVCGKFEPGKVFEFDSYYCGCRGWD